MLLIKLIERIPFFDNLTSEERELLAESGSFFQNFDVGDYIIEEDGDDTNLFILIRGQVKVTKNHYPEKSIAVLKEGAVFGELSFLTKRLRTTNVIAEEQSMVFRVDGESLESMECPLQNKIKDKLIQILVNRLDEMTQALVKITR